MHNTHTTYTHSDSLQLMLTTAIMHLQGKEGGGGGTRGQGGRKRARERGRVEEVIMEDGLGEGEREECVIHKKGVRKIVHLLSDFNSYHQV